MKKLNIKWLKKEIDLNIDFRSDVYLQNNYGNFPQIKFERAAKIIKEAHRTLENKIGNSFHMYNINSEIDGLKIETLKQKLDHYLFLANKTLKKEKA